MRLLFAFCLFSSVAGAQQLPSQYPGIPVRAGAAMACDPSSDMVCATTATMVLYVDPMGSDSNKCTASGTAACQTLAGALAKVPYRVRHNVTVNVAAGSYTAAAEVKGFNIEKGVTLAITGTASQRTPTTGNVTGSVTASSTWSTTSASTITDSAQSWTVNDLKGTFIKFTSGSLNGQAYPIFANTATTITAPFGTSAVAVGVTYELVTIATIFTSTSTHTYGSISGAGTLAFSFISIRRASGATWGNAANSDTGNITCTSCDLRGTSTSSSVAVSHTSGQMSLTRTYAVSASTSSSPTVANSATSRWTCTSCYLYATGNGGALNSSSVGPTVLLTSILEAVSAGTQPVWEVNAGNNSASNLWVECLASWYGVGQAQAYEAIPGRVTLFKTTINKCNYGLIVTRAMQGELTVNPGNYFSAINTLTAFAALYGSTIMLNGYAPTFSGVTNQLDVDGDMYSYDFLNGLSPATIIGPNRSTLFR